MSTASLSSVWFEREVLAAPRPRHLHRLHTHERTRPLRRELTEDTPAVPGRLAPHRHAGEALRRGPARHDRGIRSRTNTDRLPPWS